MVFGGVGEGYLLIYNYRPEIITTIGVKIFRNRATIKSTAFVRKGYFLSNFFHDYWINILEQVFFRK